MAAVGDRFVAWSDASSHVCFRPAIVSDPTDGQIANLHGLNLPRTLTRRCRAPAARR